jgi:hypothetical protein
MTEEPSVFPEYSQDDLNRAHEEALEAARRAQMDLTESAADAGYLVISISNTKPQLDDLLGKAQNDPSAYPIVASGIDYLRGLTSQLNSLGGPPELIRTQLDAMTNSTGTFVSSTDSGTAIWNPSYKPVPFSPPPNRKTREYYSKKLRAHNASLADSYDQVWQSQLATSADPYRAALFVMRTLVDNFFAWLAPDDAVRASTHWHLKDGEKPTQIWRVERIAYALEKIPDPNRRALLQAEAPQITALYEGVNEAHNRDSLNEDKASRTLAAMDSFLTNWIDALP